MEVLKSENLRVGDIIYCGDRRKMCFGTLTRINTSKGNFGQRWGNAFNKNFVCHVCQVVKLNDSFVIKDTKGTGLEITNFSYYLNSKEGYVVDIGRPSIYGDLEKQKALCNRTAAELASLTERQRKYDWGGITRFVWWMKKMRVFRGLAKNDPILKYCSERVRDDLEEDGGLISSEIDFSPYELSKWPQQRFVRDEVIEGVYP